MQSARLAHARAPVLPCRGPVLGSRTSFVGKPVIGSPMRAPSARCPVDGQGDRAETLGMWTRRPRQVRANFKRNGLDIADRVIASAVYLVPLCDGLRFSKFFFLQFPSFAVLMIPFEPAVRLFYSFPFAGLIAFLGLQLGVVNNRSLSRFIRFNSMQAILLDIILIFPSLLTNVFGNATSSIGLQFQISLFNTVWLFTFACVVYAMASCLLGQYARLPLVADAADAQVPM